MGPIEISELKKIFFNSKEDKYDENGVLIVDEPILSPKRIIRAICLWIWFIGEFNLYIPFWYFVRYSRRPYANHKAGKY